MNNLFVVILAAGKGTRMKSDLPKVLFKIGDKTLVEYGVDTAKKLNPENIIVVVGHGKEMVQEILGDKVDYALQDEQLGTGHALMQTKNILADKIGYVLVSNGDMPFISQDMHMQLYNKCINEGASAAMMTVETEDYSSWGRIVRDKDGNVNKIIEAKDADEDTLKIIEKNTGVYCFKINDLFAALNKIESNNAQQEYYLTDVIEILESEGKKIIAVITDDYKNIIGINTPDELNRAREIIKNGNNKN